MTVSYRRIIRRPVDVGDDDWSRLESLIGESVERQTQLAADSPHTLRFTGGLQPLADGGGWYIEHEAATCMPIGGLFDRTASAIHESEILRITVAIYDALRAACTREGPARTVHGAVCPGVILFAPDGTAKLTDFGFAPAICTVLGEVSYKNLSIGPEEGVSKEQGGDEVRTTGAWEVLAPDEIERDGRICGFIDPEKYGSDTLGAFEPAADIIAAAFVVHLLAEHQHPYLPDDVTAYRMVEMSELMAMGRYNGARRSDLRSSANPGVVQWCELISNALARVPQARPTAAQIVEALREHVRPDDEGAAVRRQLASLEALARDQAWAQLAQDARTLSGHIAAATDVVQRANALAVEAAGRLLIDKARNALGGQNWPDAQEPVEQALAMPGLPADLASTARQLRANIADSLGARDALDEINAQIRKDDGADPFATVELTQALIGRVGEIRGKQDVLPQVQSRIEAVHEDLTRRLEAALPAAQAAMAEARQLAEGWVEKLEAAMADEQWESIEELLGNRPDLAHWPEDTQALADAAQRKLDDHGQELKRQEAVQSDHAAARLWADQLRLSVDAEKWDRAKQLLEDKPSLTHWPVGLVEEVDGIAEAVRAAFKKQSEEREGRRWCGRIREAVEREDFAAGADVLSARPALSHWPADVLDEVRRYEKQLQSWIEAAERKRKEEEQQKRRVQEWLDRASLAAKNEQWEETLRLLGSPPEVERLPDQVREEAARLAETCQKRIDARAQAEFKSQVQAVEAAAREFVRRVVTEQFETLLHPDSINVWLEAVALTPERLAGGLQVNVRPRFDQSEAAPDESESTITFHFRIDPASRKIREEESLRGQLANKLESLVNKLERWGLLQLAESIQVGIFPKAAITVVPGEPTATLPATVRLLGPESSAGSVETEVCWDRSALSWAFRDQAALVRRGLGVAVETITRSLEEKLLDDAAAIKNYRSLLGIEVTSSFDPNLREFPKELRLEGSITIRPGGPVEPRTLQRFPIACRQVHDVACDISLAQTIDELGKVVLAAQRTHWTEIKEDLQERISLSGRKAKFRADPGRLDSPAAKVAFFAQAKGRDALELVLQWDAKAFKFTFPEGWENTLDRCLPLPKSKTPGQEGKRRVRARTSRPALIMAGIVVAIAVWIAWPSSNPPIARAGVDQTVEEGDTVTLNGSGSTDPDGDQLSYRWQQTSGEPVSLSRNSIASPTFVAPEGLIDMTLTFKLLVSDGDHENEDSVSILVKADNDPPTAVATAPVLVNAGERVKLDGSRSTDPEGAALTYEWTQTEGPNVALQGADTESPEFDTPRPPERTALTFQLRVGDGVNTAGNSVTVQVDAEPTQPDPCIALEADQIRLTQQLEKVTAGIASPVHEAIIALHKDQTVDYLEADENKLAEKIQSADAGESPLCAKLAGEADTTLKRLTTLRDKLSAYGAAFDADQKSVPEQLELLQKAKDAFATERVEGLLPKLEEAVRLQQLAMKQIDQNWRAARQFLDEAAAQADTPELQRRLSSAIEEGRRRLIESRRQALEPLLAEDKQWLDGKLRPVDSVRLFDLVEEPAEARRRLDDLDLNYPVQNKRPESCKSMLQAASEDPFTWLTEEDQQVIVGLEDWVTVSLVLTSQTGAPQEVVVFEFIPEAHEAAIDPFWISQTEVTVGQYKAVTDGLPSDVMRKEFDEMKKDDAHPIAFLSAKEAAEFCKALSDRLGGGMYMRLPRPDEWHHALFAGRGDMTGCPQLCAYPADGPVALDPRLFNCESDENYQLLPPGHLDCFGLYAPVGSYPPNRWLLYDMLGNVSEWVSETQGGTPTSVGSSFLTSAEDPNNHTNLTRRAAYDAPEDVGLRIVLQPTPK